jgi:hypothetical protein
MTRTSDFTVGPISLYSTTTLIFMYEEDGPGGSPGVRLFDAVGPVSHCELVDPHR